MQKNLIAAALAFAFALPVSAYAEEAKKEDSPHTVTANLTLASEYIYRGIAQTNRKPAIQAGVDYSHSSGLYLGMWGSNISWLSDSSSDISAPVELDFYGGYKKTIGDFSFDIGALQYYYPGDYTPGYNRPYTTEAYVGAGYKWFTFKYSHSLTDLFGFRAPDGRSTKNSQYYDLSANFDLGSGFSLVPHVGYQKVSHFSDASYTDWKIGINKDFRGFTFGLAYVDSNANGKAGEPYHNSHDRDLGKARALFTISKTL